MHSGLFQGLIGNKYADDYRKQFAWTKKTGAELNTAAFDWHKKGRATDYETKPEGWLSRDEMTSQIADLNKRYDSLKIDYDKMLSQRAPTVQQSNVNWRDQHGGYGSQTTNVDNVKISQAAAASKKKVSSAPKQAQTYTGSASL
tara:strand:+ start:372 stop:803 length:432 start_codon:yes stop_codon:yes gene_type:complete